MAEYAVKMIRVEVSHACIGRAVTKSGNHDYDTLNVLKLMTNISTGNRRTIMKPKSKATIEMMR